jgi:hypothetical protein
MADESLQRRLSEDLGLRAKNHLAKGVHIRSRITSLPYILRATLFDSNAVVIVWRMEDEKTIEKDGAVGLHRVGHCKWIS